MNWGFYFILYAVFGMTFESLFTGIADSIKRTNPRLKTRSSIWMFPIYGSLLFIVIIVQFLYSSYPWYFRGFMYMMLILAWEYFSGLVIKNLVGVAPWDYSTNDTYDDVGRKKRFHINGLICLEYAPAWFFGGLLAEWFFIFLESHFLF